MHKNQHYNNKYENSVFKSFYSISISTLIGFSVKYRKVIELLNNSISKYPLKIVCQNRFIILGLAGKVLECLFISICYFHKTRFSCWYLQNELTQGKIRYLSFKALTHHMEEENWMFVSNLLENSGAIKLFRHFPLIQ